MLELNLSTPAEIVKRLCGRLRTERLALEMTQADVAARAGIGINTVSNLESGRNVGRGQRVATINKRGNGNSTEPSANAG